MKQIILYKTHVWCDSIELDVIKLINETSYDFRVILHDEAGELFAKIKSEKVRERTLVVTEALIQKLYPKGFINMFLSNHWLLMWFYTQHTYDYYWTIEYDVKIIGHSDRVWQISSTADLLFPIGNKRVSSENKYTKTAIGLEAPLYAGFIQIARYSKRALDYLHSKYSQGMNAQDEIAIFTLLHKSNLVLESAPLWALIKGVWTFDSYYQQENLKQWQYLKQWATPDELYIMHPIKPVKH